MGDKEGSTEENQCFFNGFGVCVSVCVCVCVCMCVCQALENARLEVEQKKSKIIAPVSSDPSMQVTVQQLKGLQTLAQALDPTEAGIAKQGIELLKPLLSKVGLPPPRPWSSPKTKIGEGGGQWVHTQCASKSFAHSHQRLYGEK